MESTEDSTGVDDHELAEAPLKSVSVCASVFVFVSSVVLIDKQRE